MRFKSLADLKRQKPKEVTLATLPQEVSMTHYAKEKAFKISELVREIHEESYEWYGFTIADKENPELITDIGLPQNDQNLLEYAAIGPARIAEYHDSLSEDTIINGWIHSHGALQYMHFSHTDEENQATVLDFVTEKELEEGSVSLITDAVVSEAILMETIYGGFSYSIVIGDEGWHEQEIHYQERSVISGHSHVSKKSADLVLIDNGRSLTQADIIVLSKEVAEKIQPNTNPPTELIERM